MIPFYGGTRLDCFNCIYSKILRENGEWSCREGHEIPQPYECCVFYKNEYRQRVEIINEWFRQDVLTEEQKQQALIWKSYYERKAKEQEEIDVMLRKEEEEISKKGMDEIFRECLDGDD